MNCACCCCYRVDPDSSLASDMKTMMRKDSQDYILFHFLFKDTFPFEPPFVRLVSPTISNGFVLGGGAICMELLTKQGWSSAYSIESLILQIAATLVKGKVSFVFLKFTLIWLVCIFIRFCLYANCKNAYCDDPVCVCVRLSGYFNSATKQVPAPRFW
ncbi:unnamed protein product [Gongylonema pulchrum]|uniref:UBIQUITIN_CONJUGAT_2 domain-containing protein n=1 Tax=Gongylonema pulchrum TaxID=637853 RepID=A0A183DRS3_9BILA|nr:unnamed protein product [Gongylonema pulchrum]